MSDKPKVLVMVLCQAHHSGWINPQLCEALLVLQRDSRFDLQISFMFAVERVEVARNCCVRSARRGAYDFLAMTDNDMRLPDRFGDVLEEIIGSGKAVVGLRSARVDAYTGEIQMLVDPREGPREGNLQRVGCLGGGVLVLSSEVWRRVRGPWFTWQVNDDEVLSRKLSEDYSFSELMRENNITIWAHQAMAGHLKVCDVTLYVGPADERAKGTEHANAL